MLSVAIVCRNSERTIGRTLDSIAGLADEIIAVDSGSSDGTVALLERHRARVIRSDWLGYARTKQLALDACTHNWVLNLDSDESVEPDLAASIRAATIKDSPALYRINRKTWYAGRPLNFAWQPERILRLAQKSRARWSGTEPHAALAPSNPADPIADLPGTLRHDSFVTFSDHLARQLDYARIAARALYAAGHRARRTSLLISPPGAFLKQLILKQAWRDGLPGWLAAATTAAGTLMKHAILLELSRTPGPSSQPPPESPAPTIHRHEGREPMAQ